MGTMDGPVTSATPKGSGALARSASCDSSGITRHLPGSFSTSLSLTVPEGRAGVSPAAGARPQPSGKAGAGSHPPKGARSGPDADHTGTRRDARVPDRALRPPPLGLLS
ncbi:hypothetical protein GCM10010340_40400 [Streptomyces griseoloalbus]|nr:hypothetical protein GCM10010340_40400 [Streptomyces albaduncus]